ncbi:hypothetical protein [Yersinia intermedia]|uniref:hypothetical protein n=1 Tax=Yersinia intermedia TaxID=631 RepID=UPI001CFD7ADE|nr:hypothetical protein [Yersinia intermedia]MCB5312118.1 hypothetical protein [Yersinia intermedia]MCB5326136.1 hypothetical protein [Yersinia intermedia]
MNIKELLEKIREISGEIDKAQRLLDRRKNDNFYISSSDGPTVYIHIEQLAPIIERKIEVLSEKLKVPLDAQLTAERVIAGLIHK